MSYNRTTTINPAPGGDTVKTATLKLDTDLTGAFTHLNTVQSDVDANQAITDAHASATGAHGATGAVVGTTNTQTLTNKTLTSPKLNENVVLAATSTQLDGAVSHVESTSNPHSVTASQTGAYTSGQVDALLSGKEPADATILKDADIGVNVAAQVHNHDSLYSVLAHNHALNNLTEKSYNSLTDKPSIPSVAGLLDEIAHDALDHAGLTGIPSAYTLPTASTTTLGGVKVDGSSITINESGVITASAGGISDGDKGDITVSGSGATWAIDNNAVTEAKMSRTGTAGQVLASGGPSANPGYINQSAVTAGAVSVIDPAKTIGYGAGAGGTVTQLTSKSTTVTLNKPTGQITMNNTALVAGANVLFTVNNSIVNSYDTIALNQDSNSPNAYSYRIELISCGTGTFRVRVTNVSGGALSDAVLINFAIIKGATS